MKQYRITQPVFMPDGLSPDRIKHRGDISSRSYQSVAPIQVTGPELWAELHNYQWTTYLDFQDWFALWLAKVDRLPYCSCGSKFRSKILPRFSNRFCAIANNNEWFAVSVEMHNAVNRELKKPEITTEEAVKQRNK